MKEPNIVYSGLSLREHIGDFEPSIEIYRLEDRPLWTLEVVDQEGTSTLWNEQFKMDEDALDAVETVIREEAAAAFRGNVIPFRKR